MKVQTTTSHIPSQFHPSLFILAILVLALGLQSCTSEGGETDSLKPKVVCTTAMIGDIISNLANEEVELKVLMGPGTDPHYYTPKQSDRKALKEADLIFVNGLRLEGEMAEILEKYGSEKPVVAVAEGVAPEEILYPDDQGIADPHIWLSPRLWAQAATAVHKGLEKLDALDSEELQSNLMAYQKSLLDLHESAKVRLAEIPEESRILITSHDAFEYFSRDFNIEVDALQGISTVAEAGLRDVTELVETIVERKVKALFFESTVSPKGLEAVMESCEAEGHSIINGGSLYTDAMGDAESPEATYIGMFEYNINTICKALK